MSMVRAQRRRGAGRRAAPRRRGTAGGRGCTTGCPGLVSLKPPASPAGAGPRCRGHGEGDPGSGRRAGPGPAAVRAPGRSCTRLLTDQGAGGGRGRRPWAGPCAPQPVSATPPMSLSQKTLGGWVPLTPWVSASVCPGPELTHTPHTPHTRHTTHTTRTHANCRTS